MSLLVDTNVVSELARPRPNEGVAAWAGGVTRMGLSVIVLEELKYGLTWKPSPRIEAWLDAFIAHHCDVFGISREVALTAGGLRGMLAARGIVRSQSDMLIAATALVNGLTVVTRNTSDFEGCGVAVLNPFA